MKAKSGVFTVVGRGAWGAMGKKAGAFILARQCGWIWVVGKYYTT